MFVTPDQVKQLYEAALAKTAAAHPDFPVDATIGGHLRFGTGDAGEVIATLGLIAKGHPQHSVTIRCDVSEPDVRVIEATCTS